MTIQNPYPSGHPYAGPPPVPQNIPARDLRPRRVWYLVAALLGIVLAAVGAVFLVVTVKDTVHSIDTDRSFSNGESRTFRFVEGETKAVYVSQSGRAHVECRIPGMRSGSMSQPDSTFRVTTGSRTWERVFEVKPGSSGDYPLTCTSEVPAEFALGDRPQVGATIGSIAAGVGCLLAAFFASATIVVVTAVRRSRHRRRLMAAWARPPQWGPPPSGPVS
ncbi:serine/arginine repetitive matrix protein 2 [Streptomyces nogalater]|uniref:Serine/arginine repetitive matrix protein 2 n=1 Tax=Streptomyces nogalater TaxID=38314 RepID=A0ABW0WJA0_STRNO